MSTGKLYGSRYQIRDKGILKKTSDKSTQKQEQCGFLLIYLLTIVERMSGPYDRIRDLYGRNAVVYGRIETIIEKG